MNIHFKKISPNSTLEVGTYRAVVTGIIETGRNKSFKDPINSIMIEFTILGGSNNELGKVYNLYAADLASNSKLRLFLEQWRGRNFTSSEIEDFQIETILKQPLEIDVIEIVGRKGTTYFSVSEPSNLTLSSSLIDNLVTVKYDFQTDGFSDIVLDRLPEQAVKFITYSLEYQEYQDQSSSYAGSSISRQNKDSDNNTDVPF